MNRIVLLAAVCLFAAFPASSAVLKLGDPADVAEGSCAPFGCGVQYQQLYDASAFSGTITISGLTFYNVEIPGGSIADANYTIHLSTTSKLVNGLDSLFANNIGGDDSLFYTGFLGGSIGGLNEFTITGAPFLYDPTLGNLLLSITSDGAGDAYSVYLDWRAAVGGSLFSSAFSLDNSGVVDAMQSNAGLVTGFVYGSSSLPEPSSVVLLATGLLLCGKFQQRKRR